MLAGIVLVQIKLDHNPFLVETAIESKRRWRQVASDLCVFAAILSV